MVELITTYQLYCRTMTSNWDFISYDRSKLCAIHQTAMNIINSIIGIAARDAVRFNPRLIGFFDCTNKYSLKNKIDHYYT